MREVGNCTICGFKDWMNIHHKDRNHNNNNLDNLIKICRSCHSKEHAYENAEFTETGEYDSLDFMNRNKGHNLSHEFRYRYK